jgi:Pyruvate kinase, barrel domain
MASHQNVIFWYCCFSREQLMYSTIQTHNYYSLLQRKRRLNLVFSNSKYTKMKFTSVLLCAAFLATGIDAFVAPRTATIITKLAATVQGTNGAAAATMETTVAAVPKVAQRWRKSTKQVATLGPASSTVEMIETLFLAGADVFRLNFSHGSQEQKKDLLDMIRSVEVKYSHPIAILGDLQGPKLRVSTLSCLGKQMSSTSFRSPHIFYTLSLLRF